MLRALFEKTGNAVWMSHLDLMRLFQRAFKRADLHLKHTQGFNPRPSVSIALPMSVGVESVCELLDFELDGQELSCDEICRRLNDALVDGVTVREVYDTGRKIKYLASLDDSLLTVWARVCCQNPTLNPALIANAVERYLPECRPDHVSYRRIEIYDTEETIFR